MERPGDLSLLFSQLEKSVLFIKEGILNEQPADGKSTGLWFPKNWGVTRILHPKHGGGRLRMPRKDANRADGEVVIIGLGFSFSVHLWSEQTRTHPRVFQTAHLSKTCLLRRLGRAMLSHF